MQYLNISNFSLNDLNIIIDFVGQTCDKIFLTELSTDSKKSLIGELKKYIFNSKRVTIWDGTEIGPDIDCNDGKIPEELKPIQYLVQCNAETIKILKKYNNFKKRGLFSMNSFFDIAFYNSDVCYFFTTPHEDSICFGQEFYKVIKEHINVKSKNKGIIK